MDNYLPIYSEILNEICPIPAKSFAKTFDEKLSEYMKVDSNSKRIKNHRTESVDKLLGLIFEKEGIIYLSDRSIKYLRDNDQPALFKSICYKFQQPNGSQKISTTIDKIQHNISFKPYHFVLSLLKLARQKSVLLTKKEIAYYVLNALQVLQGKVSVDEVLSVILYDREKGLKKEVDISKNYAWGYQHINEQFDYLKLANLIREDKEKVWLNTKEQIAIDYFIDNLNKPLALDYSKYNLEEKKIGKKIESDWQIYFGSLDQIEEDKFKTSINSLDTGSLMVPERPADSQSSTELGNDGEIFVFNHEKNIVKSFNPRLVNKVKPFWKIKGLGYDIISIEASRNLKNPEFTRYIEVKTTKRVSKPNFTDTWDSINMTRNEWVAAEQHKDHFYIYRIYFTNDGTFVSIINDPVRKNNENILYATPTTYRVEFSDQAVDEKLKLA
jgi:hypothetical protein